MQCWVKLKHPDLLQARAHILSDKLVGCKLLVQETVPEHHASPKVKELVERSIELTLTLFLNTKRIKQSLRDADVLAL